MGLFIQQTTSRASQTLVVEDGTSLNKDRASNSARSLMSNKTVRQTPQPAFLRQTTESFGDTEDSLSVMQ